jgi:predicted alpha/beta hydrolase family esterase
MNGPEPQHDEPAYGAATGPAPGAPGAAATPPVSNAVIVHGKPGRAEYYDPDISSSSNHHWLPWLAKQLIVRDIPAHTPEMPHAYAPDYALWSREFERFDIGPGTLLVGHSCGAGFLVRWLSEHPRVRVNRVVLVAPWLDPDRVEAAGFFDFHIDDGLVSRTAGVTVVNSDDDTVRIQRSVRLLLEHIQGIAYLEFHGYGHFGVSDLGGIAFPELLTLLTQPGAHAVVAAGQPADG